MLRLHTISSQRRKQASRVGRGIAAGQGKTAGRGTKGQKSRTGSKVRVNIPNLPKLRGFRSRFKKPITLNWQRIQTKFKSGPKGDPSAGKITTKKLIGFGLIKKGQRFKIVGKPKKL